MAEFVILTDSCCDLPLDLAQNMQVDVLPLTVYMDDKEYRNYLDEREISYKEFYELLPKVAKTKTSAVNQHEFITAMEPHLQAGKDLLYLGFSSGLSGTFSAGMLAAQELQEKYPERKVYAVDTLEASLGQGLFVYLCWKQQQAGKTIEEVRDYAEANKMAMCAWFTVNDLMHLKRGGRVSATTALLGTALSIKPIMHVDDEGHLIPMSKARGRKASIKSLVSEMKKRAIKPEEQVIAISHGGCPEDAELLANLVREEMHVQDVIINYVGPVIGSHSGPGTLALFFMGTER